MKYPSTTQWNQVTKVNDLLKKAGLSIKARCQTCMDIIEVHKLYIEVDIPTITAFEGPQGNRLFKADTFIKIEELNEYFDPEIFVMGIIQRKDYLLASHEVKVECYKQNLHPAMYKTPTDDTDVMQDMPNPIPVERKEGKKTLEYPNGYQGKIDFYISMAADHIGKDDYSYFESKVKYFLKRQEAWLIENKTSNI